MKPQDQKRPIANSYQVNMDVVELNRSVNGRLWGGEYPGDKDPTLAQERLERLLDAGITHFINLTEADERSDHYDAFVAALAANRDTAVSHQRISIRDYSTPTPETLNQILDKIDAALAQGDHVYVHCWGGIGRTGTVIGCWLVRHGISGEQALDHIAEWRKDTPKGDVESPETLEQRNMILNWHESE